MVACDYDLAFNLVYNGLALARKWNMMPQNNLTNMVRIGIIGLLDDGV